MIQVQSVHPNIILQVWDQVEPLLAKGLQKCGGEYTVEHLKVYLIQGVQHLVVSTDEQSNIIGAAAVEFINYPNERVAFITSIGGKMVANKEVWDQFAAWCKYNGATMIRGAAFESVARLWKKAFGVEQRYVIVEKKL